MHVLTCMARSVENEVPLSYFDFMTKDSVSMLINAAVILFSLSFVPFVLFIFNVFNFFFFLFIFILIFVFVFCSFSVFSGNCSACHPCFFGNPLSNSPKLLQTV